MNSPQITTDRIAWVHRAAIMRAHFLSDRRMAIPTNYIKKRDVLHAEKTSPQTLIQIGREFLAAERYSDALDFFEKAKDLSGLTEIKQLAVKLGDAFLLS